jgi:hypothetical protein
MQRDDKNVALLRPVPHSRPVDPALLGGIDLSDVNEEQWERKHARHAEEDQEGSTPAPKAAATPAHDQDYFLGLGALASGLVSVFGCSTTGAPESPRKSVPVGEEVIYYDTASVDWADIIAPTTSGNRIIKSEAQAIFRYLQVEEKGVPDGATRHVIVFSTGRINTIDFANNASVGYKEIGDAFSGLSDLVCLRLHKESLRGRLPSYLFTLFTLEVLDLSENGLEGGLSKEIEQLRNLEVLNISRNRLAGPLPAELGNLGKLETLVLDHNHFSSFPDLSRCQKLTFVDVKKNPELRTAELRDLLPPGAELFV